MKVRPAAVSGMLYSGEAQVLRAEVAALLRTNPADAPPPKALVAPHAGCVYSGPVAATAYNPIRPRANQFDRKALTGTGNAL
jgi:AmmeMemoRadiSam system protein B